MQPVGDRSSVHSFSTAFTARARLSPGIDQRLPPAHGGGGAGRIAVRNPPAQRPKAHSQATVSEDRGRRGAVLRRGPPLPRPGRFW